MGLSGRAKKLSIYVGEADMYEGRPLWEALVEQARTAGCAGATVLRGCGGFGATSRKHAKHKLRMSVDHPLLVHVVDRPDKITALAEVYAAMVGDGLMTVEDVNVMFYRGGVTGGPEE